MRDIGAESENDESDDESDDGSDDGSGDGSGEEQGESLNRIGIKFPSVSSDADILPVPHSSSRAWFLTPSLQNFNDIDFRPPHFDLGQVLRNPRDSLGIMIYTLGDLWRLENSSSESVIYLPPPRNASIRPRKVNELTIEDWNCKIELKDRRFLEIPWLQKALEPYQTVGKLRLKGPRQVFTTTTTITAKRLQTFTFLPTNDYIERLVNRYEVAELLGELRARRVPLGPLKPIVKLYLVTGVRVIHQGTVTNKYHDWNFMPDGEIETIHITGPAVFAYSLHKLRWSRTGNLTVTGYFKGDIM
jgi:hypothetical protein